MLDSITQKINALRQRVEEEKARVEADGEPSPVFAFLAEGAEALAWIARGFFSVFVAGLLAAPVLLILPRLNAVDAAWPAWFAATYLVWWSIRPRSEDPKKVLCVVVAAMLGAVFLPLMGKYGFAFVKWFFMKWIFLLASCC